MEFTAAVGGNPNNAGRNFFSNNNFLLPPEDVPRDPIPPKPSMFLGRDELLHGVAEHLSSNRHVALLGPGGIGKSSIAKVLLHAETIIQTFGDQRFFVRFDGIDSSQVTFHMFFERIAKALGVKAGKHPDSSVRKYLSNPSGKMLLVLDNAETFLQAPDREIKPAFDELADMPSVTMLLTTRIQISFKSRLETIKVPPLDEQAAYATFAKIYGTDVCPPDAKILISTLQFHPLSIILLAQVAKKDYPSSEKLVKAWKKHQTRLLNNGNVKGDSLKITIELSLDSPSIQERGENARHFLRAIAFLPQGVDEEKLKDLFPKVVEVDLLAHELCNHSLLYRDGEKITMLAPIRLYLTDEGEPEPSLLADVRTYYYSQLEKFADPEQETEGAAWITMEDINVERLVALDLRAHADMQTSCQACVRFVSLLIRHKLRPTTLYPAVDGLPQREPKLLEKVRLHVQPAFRRVHPLVAKGTCLQSLALLAENLGQTTEALNLYKEAEKLFSLARDRDEVSSCVRDMGDVYSSLGDFVKAGDLFKKAQSKSKRPDAIAALNLSLGHVAMFTGNSEGRRLLLEAEHYYKHVGNRDSMNNAIEQRGYSEMYSGNYQAAGRCFEQIETNAYTLVARSEVLLRSLKVSEALELLDQGVEAAKDDQQSGLVMAVRAAVTSDQGDFVGARDQIDKAAKKATLPDNSENAVLAFCAYISARNELFAGEHLESKNQFSLANTMFEELGDIRFQARCERALGEIAFLQNDSQQADNKFEKVRSLCKRMHISEDLLYICLSCFFLKESFRGWKTYQGTHPSNVILTPSAKG